VTIDPRLDPERCETGVLPPEQFRSLLADAAAEFQAVQYLRRRRRQSKGRSSDPIDPPFEAAPAGTDELFEELR
jgi:hypothetical protein